MKKPLTFLPFLLLPDYTVDINTKDDDGNPALITATLFRKTDAIQVLLDHGADINAKDKNGNTALMWATIMGHTDVVRLLIDKGSTHETENIVR